MWSEHKSAGQASPSMLVVAGSLLCLKPTDLGARGPPFSTSHPIGLLGSTNRSASVPAEVTEFASKRVHPLSHLLAR